MERILDRSTSAWVTEDQSLGASIAKFDIRSLMVVPVRARGVTLGVATFARSRRRGPFEDDDVRLAEELVSRAALCVDNARRFTRERTAARSMQRYLLPQDLTGGSALEVASWYLPADAPSGVGGDWFDVIPLSGTRVALVVGDVVGHGINAAATMGRLRTAVRTLANLDLPRTNCWLIWTTWSSASWVRRRPRTRPRVPRSWVPPVCTRCTTRSADGSRWPGPATSHP